ncbi:hypothetical protein [Paenibacillus physcomitrellae]|uniref:Sporulation membrane protein YtrI C-terminal domain-containing protein n=1 Tax=Paenibacillus physcomitrellae TaxID=1619311 RepID=A0ABQ1GY24_9BACL|nr:hypothetical protein [Paenibacillus physcomitrellae]GGA52728.1 hypothetical protein GCM10010917_42450 [Paenibacillus physcomitrellae]
MRVPQFDRFRPFMQLAGVFVLGMLAGSLVYNSLYHAAYNRIWTEKKDLQIELEQAKIDLQAMKKYSRRQTAIKEIKITIEEHDPPFDSLVVKEVTQKLQTELNVLRGRNMYDIDSDAKMTRILLNQKRYVVRDKEYSIQIKTMLVSEGVLQVWVDLKAATP